MCDWSEADVADYKVLLGWWRVLSRDYNDTSNCLWRSALTMLTLRRTLILITELRSDLLWRGGFCLIFTLLPGLSQSLSDNEFKSARHKKLTNYAYLEDKSICTSSYLDSLLCSGVSGCWSWSEMWLLHSDSGSDTRLSSRRQHLDTTIRWKICFNWNFRNILLSVEIIKSRAPYPRNNILFAECDFMYFWNMKHTFMTKLWNIFWINSELILELMRSLFTSKM